jgi:hypothetical protein
MWIGACPRLECALSYVHGGLAAAGEGWAHLTCDWRHLGPMCGLADVLASQRVPPRSDV